MDIKRKELDFPTIRMKSVKNEVRSTETEESNSKKCRLSRATKGILGMIFVVLVIILIIVLCKVNVKKEKKGEKEEKEEEILNKENKDKYIIGTYNAQKDIPLKLFNPSRLGLNDQNYNIDDISKKSNIRRLKQADIFDGVIIPEETGKIQIKISFNTPLTSLDFMFEKCSDLVAINLTNINSPSITSMIYTFTDCTNLETVDLTSFSSHYIKKMDFLFSGCTNLVSIKGFENLDTSSLKKTAGMFLDCQNLISVNLSSLYLDNISESNGMFINNPSLELLDLGNVTNINGLFSSTEFYKIIIISSSIKVNTSGLKGVFSIMNRAANQRLNCSLRNWTDFIMKHIDLENINEFLPDNFTQIIKEYENYFLDKNLYDELIKIKYLDCNSFNNTFLYFNYSECEKYKRLYIDFLNENEKCIECDDEEGRSMYCKKCSKGYYLSKSIDNIPTRCKRCDEGCLECIADDETGKSICLKCKENNYDESNYEFDSEYDNRSEYKLYNGKCIKKCEIGINEKCQSCNEENGKYDECLTCNEGYYYNINYNKGICKKINNCNSEQGKADNCQECDDGYYLSNNNVQAQCSKCPNNCQKCNNIDNYNVNCTECDTGFYLAKSEANQYSYYYNPFIFYKCLKCNMPGCKKYKPNSNKCICIECDSNDVEKIIKNGDIDNEYISCYGRCEIGELDKCKTCGNNIGECGECNEGYVLNSEGKCIKNFHILAKYKTTYENEYVKFMAFISILNMTINGTVINNPKNSYTFPLPGEHLVYIQFYGSISFSNLFEGIIHLTYIKFLPKGKEFYIDYMNNCFSGCTNLEYVDLSNLNLTNNKCFMNLFQNDKKLKEVKFPVEYFGNQIIWFYRMFYGCESLTSIDLSNMHNTNGQYYYEMFYGCINLKSINLGGFYGKYSGTENYNIFINVPKNATIIIHNNFYNNIAGQLKDFYNKIFKN